MLQARIQATLSLWSRHQWSLSTLKYNNDQDDLLESIAPTQRTNIPHDKGKKIDLWLLNKYAIRDALYIARCAYLPWTTMQLRGPSRPQVSVIGYKLM